MLNSEFIKKLQQKPEPAKRVIMWVTAALIMLMIFSVWIWNFSSVGHSSLAVEPEVSENLNQLPSVWQSFKSQLNDIFNLFKNF